MRTRAAIACALVTLVLAAAPAWAVSSALVQNVDTSAYPTVVFTLVVSPDAVSAPGEVPEITVRENGVEVEDVSVSLLVKERGPIDVVLLIDASGSMKGEPLAHAQEAARRFVESMEASDRIAVVAFASQPTLLQGFTADRDALYSAIDGLQAGGETALYDGLVEASRAFAESGAPERYIVALSDGGDTLSVSPPDSAARAVTEVKAPVYAVALESPEYNPATLETIAQVSGGRMTSVAASESLADVYQGIAEELQLRYRVEYTSGRPNTPQLDLNVTVGGDGGVVTGVAIPNPRFQATAGVTEALNAARPSTLALLMALAAAFGATMVGSAGVMLILRKDKAALAQLHFYDQLRSTDSDHASVDASTSRGALLDTLGGIAERRGFTGLVQQWLDSAGIALRANEYIFFHLLGTVFAGLLVAVLGGGAVLWAVVGIAAAVMLPLLLLQFKADKRLRDFNEQLPDILDLIAGSLRSGWGIQQSLDLVVQEVGDPARSEFRRTQAEARLGLPLEEALERMTVRMKSDDLRWVVSAISIQREVGGNLAEVLNSVSHTIRERAELQRQVTALTAESRLSMVILSVLPFAVFVMMYLVNREYVIMAMRSPVGVGSFAAGAVLLVIGIVWLNSIMKIEV